MKPVGCVLLLLLAISFVGCGGAAPAPEAPKAAPAGLGEPARDKDGKPIETPAGGAAPAPK